MKAGFLNYYEHCNNNQMFIDSSIHLGEDLTYPYVHLYERGKSEGIKISTIDTEPLENYDIIFFVDYPTIDNIYFKRLIESEFDNLILIIYESLIVMPANWDKNNYKYFKKIFTWNDEQVDDKKFFKYFSPNKIPEKFDININNKEKLCTIIAGNKFNYHPFELYSKRIEAIRWFEENHPEDFDLYGINWDKKPYITDANIWGTAEAAKLRNERAEEKPFTSYQGPVESKNETLKRYKFSICYENAKNIPGYITEKIFDCFFAGCVPIYWGAPNITEYIPSDTFIDKTKFDSYPELYDHIKNMPDETYQEYLDAIEKFVTGNKIYPFSAENFADTIINEIKEVKPKKSLISYLKSLPKKIVR
jgi:alpha(1,3/1,4) fucosyltransferase